MEAGVRGRQTESKALIVVAAQEEGKGIGRIRMRRILDASAASLMPFVEDAIVPGSVVHTDGRLVQVTVVAVPVANWLRGTGLGSAAMRPLGTDLFISNQAANAVP